MMAPKIEHRDFTQIFTLMRSGYEQFVISIQCHPQHPQVPNYHAVSLAITPVEKNGRWDNVEIAVTYRHIGDTFREISFDEAAAAEAACLDPNAAAWWEDSLKAEAN